MNDHDHVPVHPATRQGVLRHLRPAAMMVAVLASSGSVPALATDADPSPAVQGVADLCLSFDGSGLTAEAVEAVSEGLGEAIAARPLVFPTPVVSRTKAGAVSTVRVSDAKGSGALAVASEGGPCLIPGADWSLTVSHGLLQASAVRILASAGLPSDVSTEIGVELVGDEDLVRTVLRFTAAFGVGGTCWVDDGLTVDPVAGRAAASDVLRQDLHFLAPQDACTRFRAFMPDGGAGMMAIRFAPGDTVAGGRTVRFVTRTADVRDDAVVLAGTIEPQ